MDTRTDTPKILTIPSVYEDVNVIDEGQDFRALLTLFLTLQDKGEAPVLPTFLAAQGVKFPQRRKRDQCPR